MENEGFDLEGTSFSGDDIKWEGISDIILGNPEWFEAWLGAEKQCMSVEKYQAVSIGANLLSRGGSIQRNHQCSRCLVRGG